MSSSTALSMSSQSLWCGRRRSVLFLWLLVSTLLSVQASNLNRLKAMTRLPLQRPTTQRPRLVYARIVRGGGDALESMELHEPAPLADDVAQVVDRPDPESTKVNAAAASALSLVQQWKSKMTLIIQQQRWKDLLQKLSLPTSAEESHWLAVLPVLLSSSLLAIFTTRSNGTQLASFATMYAWALVGSACGFYLFLYFISIGYAAGVALPIAYALVQYLTIPSSETSASLFLERIPTILHSVLVLVWAVKSVVFFLWREYSSWPALHRRIVYANHSSFAKSSAWSALAVKVVYWMVCSFFYVALSSMGWFRLAVSASQSSPPALTANPALRLVPRAVGQYFPIILQFVGILLETLADLQKSIFKSTVDRHQWCHVGLWGHFTHPNYLGEVLFWNGSYVGCLASLLTPRLPADAPVGTDNMIPPLAGPLGTALHLILPTLGWAGICSIMQGATRSLDATHYAKYGDQEDFQQFRNRTGFFGPFLIPQVASNVQDWTLTRLHSLQTSVRHLGKKSKGPIDADTLDENGSDSVSSTSTNEEGSDLEIYDDED
jgi:Protein of unknown function (DUF1295)